jgi:hypothetical protein
VIASAGAMRHVERKRKAFARSTWGRRSIRLRQVCTGAGNTFSQKKISTYCRHVQGLSANRIILPGSKTKPSNHGVGGGGGEAAAAAAAQRAGESSRKRARDSTEPIKTLFLRWRPPQNRKTTQNLTCDHLGPHLKFESAFVSRS